MVVAVWVALPAEVELVVDLARCWLRATLLVHECFLQLAVLS
jgi:hypothetical protein